ncbi:hypothetical protein B0T10DRAFT_455116 [Thelonectria olida]|uniref:Uncharacterized protein n=1 Tax=Thelonectria olida TaxID=1576542 RepID=A0A9P9AXG2_9HYPO|nr:hypothetical protein B0T10DRAFT_455116 [Thelonectria olida]
MGKDESTSTSSPPFSDLSEPSTVFCFLRFLSSSEILTDRVIRTITQFHSTAPHSILPRRIIILLISSSRAKPEAKTGAKISSQEPVMTDISHTTCSNPPSVPPSFLVSDWQCGSATFTLLPLPSQPHRAEADRGGFALAFLPGTRSKMLRISLSVKLFKAKTASLSSSAHVGVPEFGQQPGGGRGSCTDDEVVSASSVNQRGDSLAKGVRRVRPTTEKQSPTPVWIYKVSPMPGDVDDQVSTRLAPKETSP